MNPFENALVKGAAERFSFRAGELILLADEVPDYVYLLADGEAWVRELLPDGRLRIIHRILPQEVFGHYEIITERRLMFSVFAHHDCNGLRIAAADFVALLKTQPDVSYFVMRQITESLNDWSRNPVNLAGSSTLLRVALCISADADAGGALRLTRQQIADRTRCSLRSVYRAVGRLMQLGYITNTGGAISVSDPAGLDALINTIQQGGRAG